MLDNVVLVGGLVGLMAGAAIAWILLARGRRELQRQASDAQATLAVVEARYQDLVGERAELGRKHEQLDRAHFELSGERERLHTSLEAVRQELLRETSTVAGLRESLAQMTEGQSRLDSECRVAKSQVESLSGRVQQLDCALQQSSEENRRQAEAIAQLKAGLASVDQARNDLQTRLTEQRTWVEEQTRFFEEKVTTATTKLLEDRARAFTEVNKKEMDAVVLPFKAQLEEFRQRVDHIYTADTRDRGQLHEQIVQLTNLNQTVSAQAQALTKALTISSKSTGDWGEMVLRRILEDSELRADKEYVLQQTVEGDDESRQRPDAIVYLPEDRQVVIDAKVSNKAWTDYCAAEDEETRSLRLAAHIASLRAHIRELSARDYPRSPDLKTVDFVLMFVPVEAALLTALAHDDALYQEAYRSKIVLVTPTTLMLALKLVESMWLFQRRKESTDKIAEAGRKLFEKLTVFADTFVDIGTAIERAHGTYERARGQLSTGRGNVVKLAQRMVDLGVGPGAGKVMPAQLVQLAEAADETDVADGAPVARLTALVTEENEVVEQEVASE